jgi:hypothetical protein
LPSRKLVRRIPVGRDRADRMPGPKLRRQLASIQIAGERAQIHVRSRFEDKDSHGIPFLMTIHIKLATFTRAQACRPRSFRNADRAAYQMRLSDLHLHGRARSRGPYAVVGLSEAEASPLIVELYCARYQTRSSSTDAEYPGSANMLARLPGSSILESV